MKLKASSLVEVVMALSIISIALTVVSGIFVQVNRSTSQFREVKVQSEFQSVVLEALKRDTLPNVSDWKNEEVEIEMDDPQRAEPYKRTFWIEMNQKKMWKQEFGYDE